MKTLQIKYRPLFVLLLMGIFLFNSTPFIAQSLEGKWIPPGDNGTVLQFTKDSLIIFNFDKRIDAKPYHINDNGINIGTDQVLVLQSVNHNRLRADEDRSKGSKDIVRLTPTKTTLTSAEIEKTAYFFSNDDEKRSFRFNKPNEDSKIIFKLEKIDSTYFLSQYSDNKRKKSAPIESVTPEKLVIYLSPEKSMILLRENAEINTTKTNTTSTSIGVLNTVEAIIGKWFYNHIEGRPPLSTCTKKTFFQFTEDLKLQTKPYAENRSNGNCIGGSSINGTYKVVGNDQINVTQNGKTETWKIKSITKTKLIIERNGSALTLTKE